MNFDVSSLCVLNCFRQVGSYTNVEGCIIFVGDDVYKSWFHNVCVIASAAKQFVIARRSRHEAKQSVIASTAKQSTLRKRQQIATSFLLEMKVGSSK